MIPYPDIDPVAFAIGPVKVHWYGLMYVVGFIAGWWLGRRRAATPGSTWKPVDVDDLIFFAAVGVILGGRLGWILVYGFDAVRADPLAIVRVRYKIPGTTDYREQSWEVPYTGSALALEQSSPAMRLAASAAAFSEWLVASPFAGEVTLDRVLGQLSGVPEAFGADSRPRKLEWMIRQARSLEGK